MKPGAVMILANRLRYRKGTVLFYHLAKSTSQYANVGLSPNEEHVIDAASILDSSTDYLRVPGHPRSPTRWVRYRQLVLIRK
jgi:hypothetical protein